MQVAGRPVTWPMDIIRNPGLHWWIDIGRVTIEVLKRPLVDPGDGEKARLSRGPWRMSTMNEQLLPRVYCKQIPPIHLILQHINQKATGVGPDVRSFGFAFSRFSFVFCLLYFFCFFFRGGGGSGLEEGDWGGDRWVLKNGKRTGKRKTKRLHASTRIPHPGSGTG